MSSDLILTCAALGSQHRFGPQGGTFGRSGKCDWVLPDPKRILSSIHARIAFQVGGFQLIDESTNGTFLLGQQHPIGRSRSVPIHTGMVFMAGPYEIQADIVPSVDQVPTAQPGAVPLHAHQAAAHDMPPDSHYLAAGQTYGAPAKTRQSLDPLDYLTANAVQQNGSAMAGAPAAQAVAAAPQTAPQVAAVAEALPQGGAANPPSGGGIPDDFWASLPGSGANAMPNPASPAPAGAFASQDASAFAPGPTQPVGVGAPGAPPVPGSGSSAGVSHLEALKARREQRVAALDAKAKGVDKDQARLVGAAQAQPGAAPVPLAPTPPPGAAVPAEVREEDAPPASAPAMGGAGSREEALEALLKGLGFPQADIPAELQLQLIEDVGAMTREMAGGLVAMMAARKVVKSEFRVDETRIEPKENNPFKYFKVGELALDEILLARSDGFLPPAQATHDAFQDLQSHTLITMSAMQRAMRLLFERLSPEALAQSDDDDGALRLRSLGSRRDKWDSARGNYEEMRKDFGSLMRQMFIEAFSQVQEEQARKMSDNYWNKRKK